MADNHQQTPPPAATTPPPGDTGVILPRAQEGQTPPASGDAAEKAARDAKAKMEKTTGFWNRLYPEEPKTEKPSGAPGDKKPNQPEETAAKPTPEPAKERKPKTRRREPEVDPIELARATGQEIAREIAKSTRPAAEPTVTEPEPEFPDEFKADLPVFEEMARLDPKRYGNIKKEIARYTDAESEYIAQWEEANPEQTYDGNDPEHNAFYAKIRPNYEPNDFKAAEKSLLKKEVRNEVTKEWRQHEIESEKRREQAGRIQPEVDEVIFGTLAKAIEEADPENAALAKDWNTLRDLEQKNPMLSDAIVAVHAVAKPLVTTAMRLFRNVEDVDPNNLNHQHIFNTIWRAEAEISKLPIKDRYDSEGRLFATQEEFSKMTPAERQRHWYITEPETVALLRGEAIAHTKAIYAKKKAENDRYNRRVNASQSNNNNPVARTEQTAERSHQSRSDNGSPSVTGRGTLPGDGQQAASGPTSGKDLFFNRIFRA